MLRFIESQWNTPFHPLQWETFCRKTLEGLGLRSYGRGRQRGALGPGPRGRREQDSPCPGDSLSLLQTPRRGLHSWTPRDVSPPALRKLLQPRLWRPSHGAPGPEPRGLLGGPHSRRRSAAFTVGLGLRLLLFHGGFTASSAPSPGPASPLARLRTVGVTRCLHLLIRPFWRLLASPGPEADVWAQDGVPRLRRGFRTLTNSLDIHTHLPEFLVRLQETRDSVSLPRELCLQPWGSENMTDAPVSRRPPWSLGPRPAAEPWGCASHRLGGRPGQQGAGGGRRGSACVRPVPPGGRWPRGLRRPGVCFTQVLAPSCPDCVALGRSLDPPGLMGLDISV